MADPVSDSLIKPHFFQPLLSGFHNFLNIPVRFFKKHIEGGNDNKIAKLRSDVSYKAWEVKMEGRRFTDGWKEFAIDHDFRVGDFVVFRHEGDMVFHVTGFGPGCCNLQYASSGPDKNDKSNLHNIGNVSRKKKNVNKNRKTGAKYTWLEVTASNLRLDRRFVPMGFARSNGLKNRWSEIDLMNEHGSSCTLDLRCRRKDGLVYISRGWRGFCRANGLEAGSFYKFKMVRNGTKPLLRLCPTESSENTSNKEECLEANERKSRSTKPHCRDKSSSRECSKRKGTTKTLRARRAATSSGQNRFVILHMTPYVHRTCQLRLPTHFTSLNGIKESGDVTLLDKHGVERPSYLRLVKGRRWFYMTKGCRDFIEANGLKKDTSFMLELIWGDTTPILRFCSEVQQEHRDSDHITKSPEFEEHQTKAIADLNALKRRARETVQPPRTAEESPTETETKTHKRVRVRARGPILDPDQENRLNHQEDRRTDATPTKGTTSESSRGTQSDPMAKAKQSITDALTAIRQFREVLETKEQNLEDSLRKLDALGDEI